MDLDYLVEAIMDVFESEPGLDYGDPDTNKRIRELGVHERIRQVLEDWYDELNRSGSIEEDV